MDNSFPYQTPLDALAHLVDQPRLPGARISPNFEWVCFFHRYGVESIRDLAGSELKLAGLRFNPERYAPTRAGFTYDGITLHHLSTGKEYEITGLPSAKIHAPSWSSQSRYLFFLVEFSDGLRLWSLDTDTQSAQQLSSERINGVLPGGFYRWSADGHSILTRLVCPGEPPTIDPTPIGPIIRETSDRKAPLRTYQDLLKDETDARMFEHYTTSRMARITVEGQVTHLGEPDCYYMVKSSPDGRYILVRTLQQPYSFLVPYSRFAGRYELWDSQGQLLKTLADYSAAEDLPKGFDSVRTGPREIDWRSDAPSTLVWAEALDGGDMSQEEPHHDRLFTWEAPFDGEATPFLDLEMRFDSLEWTDDNLALVNEWRYTDKWIKTWTFDPADPAGTLELLSSRTFNDHYADPGVALKRTGPLGTKVIATQNEGNSILFSARATSKGWNPCLQSWDIKQKSLDQLWSSEPPYYERALGLLDPRGEKILTLRESSGEPPNFFVRHLQSGAIDRLTDLPHPTPDFQDLKKEVITYQRADGVKLSGDLYLPPGYKGGPLPVVMWAYPLEYKDSSVAGQVTSSPYEFNRVSYWGPLPFLALGCAVFDDPKMPIIGEGDTFPNDTFIEQLVSSARAAVDTLVERGIADPDRIAIGGHSYGAFMVANLLAHSDLFKAGIARSGAYNRTLTPFGFQGEERDFWEATDVYSRLSPFFSAHKIRHPLLIIHGAEDNNPGTFPEQSERLFSALNGLGGQARLVMLPRESHAYRARESLLHMLWEQQEWLRKHLHISSD